MSRLFFFGLSLCLTFGGSPARAQSPTPNTAADQVEFG